MIPTHPSTSPSPVQAGKVYQVAAVLDGSADHVYRPTSPLPGWRGLPVGSVGNRPNLQAPEHSNWNRKRAIPAARRNQHVARSHLVNRNQRFEGVIDEFIILDRALSSRSYCPAVSIRQGDSSGGTCRSGPNTQVFDSRAPRLKSPGKGKGPCSARIVWKDPIRPYPGATNPYSEPSGSASHRFFRLAR